MEVYELELVREFKCKAMECPDTCCYGWQIALDEDTAERYKKEPGLYGRHLRSLLKKTDPPTFRRIFGACPYFNSDRLCQFQQNGREDLMPRVCRQFPRHSVQMGDIVEITVLLSCPVTAALLTQHPGRLSYIRLSDRAAAEVEPFWVIENEDIEFRDFLLKEREKLLDILWSTEDKRPLPEVFSAFFSYIHRQHDPLMQDDRRAMEAVEFSWDKNKQGKYARDDSYAFYPIRTLDRMILNHIDYGYIQLREPALYYFVKRYIKLFSDMTVDGADSYFDEKMRSLVSEYPEYELRYRSYFSYLIMQLYPGAFENYFILRQMLFAFLYVELLQLFDLLEFNEKKKPADPERMAQIIMILEKGVRHNPTQTDNLLNVIREEML